MEPKTLATIALVSSLAFTGGYVANTDESTLAVKQNKELRADFVEGSMRLQEGTTVDLALGTSEEWSQAFVDVAESQGVTITTIDTIQDISIQIQEKLLKENKLCKI